MLAKNLCATEMGENSRRAWEDIFAGSRRPMAQALLSSQSDPASEDVFSEIGRSAKKERK